MAFASVENFFNTLQDRLEAPIRDHLKNVYSCLAMSTLAAAVGGYVHLFTGILEANLITMIAPLGLFLLLSSTPDDGKNRSWRLGYLLGFAFFSGLNMGPLLNLVIHVDPSIIPTALLATAVVFIGFTLSCLFSNQWYWLHFGGTLMALLSATLVLGFANMLFGSLLLFQVQIYLGLAVMCVFVMYDTQLIVAKRRAGNKDFIRHSLDLFIDLLSIFRHLLVILTMKEREGQRNNRKSK